MIRLKHPLRFTFGFVMLVFLVVAFTSFASANTIPGSAAGIIETPVDLENVLPADCQSLQLDNVISGNGVILGTIDSDLIYGGSGADTIRGFNQQDCILGGGGDDVIFGGNSEDVILGGDGDDIIDGGNGPDICYGGSGFDTFINCESAVQ